MSIAQPREILQRRLLHQHLVGQPIPEPRAMVARLGVVQAQDFAGALWALALRVQGASLASLQCAFNRGDFLRTHVLRPTWHFVAPEDIRWMLALTGRRRIRRSTASRERVLHIDAALVSRANDAMARALEGGRTLTRRELGTAIAEAGIDWRNDGAVLGHLALAAEVDGVICSGPLKGAQHTYALLEERVPPAPVLSDEEAIAQLVCRYFSSHGPATLNDFAWWSGMTVADARQGLAAFGTRFTSQKLGELTYWFEPSAQVGDTGPDVLLLPNYDEYTVAYRSRALFFQREVGYKPGPRYDVPFGNVIVVDGVVCGFWLRPSLKAEWFTPPSPSQARAFENAAARYSEFMRRH